MVWLCQMLKQPLELGLRQGSQELGLRQGSQELRLGRAWALTLRQTMAQTLLLQSQVLPLRGSSRRLSVSWALRLAGHMRFKVRCTRLLEKAEKIQDKQRQAHRVAAQPMLDSALKLMPSAEAGSTDTPGNGLQKDAHLSASHRGGALGNTMSISPILLHCRSISSCRRQKGPHQVPPAVDQRCPLLQQANGPVLHAVLQMPQQDQQAEGTSPAVSCCAAGVPAAAGGRRLLTLPSELIEPDVTEEDPVHGDIAAFQARLGALMPHAHGRLSGAQSVEVSHPALHVPCAALPWLMSSSQEVLSRAKCSCGSSMP